MGVWTTVGAAVVVVGRVVVVVGSAVVWGGSEVVVVGSDVVGIEVVGAEVVVVGTTCATAAPKGKAIDPSEALKKKDHFRILVTL